MYAAHLLPVGLFVSLAMANQCTGPNPNWKNRSCYWSGCSTSSGFIGQDDGTGWRVVRNTRTNDIGDLRPDAVVSQNCLDNYGFPCLTFDSYKSLFCNPTLKD